MSVRSHGAEDKITEKNAAYFGRNSFSQNTQAFYSTKVLRRALVLSFVLRRALALSFVLKRIGILRNHFLGNRSSQFANIRLIVIFGESS